MKRLRRNVLVLASIAMIGSTWAPAHASDFDLLGIHYDTGELYGISTSGATPTLIGTTGIPGFGSLELAPDGTLYGFTTSTDATLYIINPADGSTTEVGPLNAAFVFDGSLVFSPGGTVYGTNHDSYLNPELFTLDILTGEATIVGTIGGGAHDINAMAWRDDGMLIGLDRVTNSLLAIDPSDASSSFIATVDPVVGAVGGMAVLGDTAYFTTSGPGGPLAGSNELYSFDLLSTGNLTRVGSLSPTITGTGISGLAVPEPASLLLMILGGFVVLRRHF
ncbi:MAG: PEP-CTERM sorting domain-containing protein [Phycisphaerae bacterium]